MLVWYIFFTICYQMWLKWYKIRGFLLSFARPNEQTTACFAYSALLRLWQHMYWGTTNIQQPHLAMIFAPKRHVSAMILTSSCKKKCKKYIIFCKNIRFNTKNNIIFVIFIFLQFRMFCKFYFLQMFVCVKHQITRIYIFTKTVCKKYCKITCKL